MKMTKKLLCVFITVVVLLGLVKWSEYILRPNDIDQCTSAIDAFHSIPQNSVDVMIYGSSHAWRGVNPIRMYDSYGIGAYNYGANWQTLSTESLFLYDSLKTQKPKVILIETYRINDMLVDSDLNGEIYYTRRIKDFPKKREYLSKAFLNDFDRYFSYFFPLSQFHSSWNDISLENFITWYTKEDFVGTMGYFYLPFDKETSVSISVSDSSEQEVLSNEAKEELNKIVRLCKEKNIELIFFTVPWEGENLYSDAMTQYAEVNDYVYLDLFKSMDEMGIDFNTDFYDEGHLNNSGAIKVADYLGEFLKENYELEDKRLLENNMWMNKSDNRTGNRKIWWNNVKNGR